jgi:hypothetical protein
VKGRYKTRQRKRRKTRQRRRQCRADTDRDLRLGNTEIHTHRMRGEEHLGPKLRIGPIEDLVLRHPRGVHISYVLRGE